MLGKVDQAVIKQNLKSMIQLAQSRDISVVLIGVPNLGLLLSDAPFYEELAHEFQIPYEGKVLAKILSTPSLKADQIHPNQAGYEKLARTIAELLKKSGAASTVYIEAPAGLKVASG